MTDRVAKFWADTPEDIDSVIEDEWSKPVAIGADSEPLDSQGGASFTGAVVSLLDDSVTAWTICKTLRRGDVTVSPLLLVIRPNQTAELDNKHDLFDDFVISPVTSSELRSRLRHLAWRSSHGNRPEVLEYGPISLNTETYQASVGGRSLDLTYMEYELLKFFVSTPGKVFSREALLNQVWGYDYYGGARTVDVHVRRLRSKLGDSHSGLIVTIRSVGYKLGQATRADG